MAKKHPMGRAPRGTASPDPKHKKAERAVLAFLIYEYPEQLTIPELSRVLNEGGGDFDSEDAVERAVRELVGVGLLECKDGYVIPTRAALYFDALEME
jgi:hypothetical protein